MAGESFVVQPVHRVSVKTVLHPVVVRSPTENDIGSPVYATCNLLNSNQQHLGQELDPVSGQTVPCMWSTDPQMAQGLMCGPSDSIYSDEIYKSRKQREKEAALGAASSSSSSANPLGGTHFYFAFTELHIFFPGTYYIGLDIYSVDAEGSHFLTGRLRSKPIEVSELPASGLGFADVPDDKERQYLKRLSHHEGAADLNIPQNYN